MTGITVSGSRAGRLVLVSGIVPTVVTALISLYRPSFLDRLEYGVSDALVHLAPLPQAGNGVVIVDVDERSLSAIGQWPWRRDVVGNLVGRLRSLGAAVIALDIVFAEDDRFDGDDHATDRALADALRAGRTVLGYAMTFDEGGRGSTSCALHQLGLAVIRPPGELRADTVSIDNAAPDEPSPFFQATGAICSLPALADAAGASGFLNASPDSDGVLRRVPLILELDGRAYPALALAAVLRLTGTRDAALRVLNVNRSSLQLADREIPLDGRANLLARYRGPRRAFPYVSAADVLNGHARPDAIRDRIVFVGTTALGTREVVTTPFDTQFAGVEVQATIADGLLRQDFIRRPTYAAALETQAVVVSGLAAAMLVWRFGLAWGATGIAAILAAIWSGAIALLARDGTLVSPLFPTMALVGGLASMTAARSAIERRRAERAGRETEVARRLLVQSLLSLTEVRDADTGRHSRRTREYARILAEELAAHPEFKEYFTRDRVELLATLAPLHDIGKVGVPDRLLNKAGALTPEELAEMRKHPAHGRDVILKAEREAGAAARDDVTLGMAKDIVYTHHEWWDGTGYPEGLRGVEIPIAGRVMALVDVYDALLARRPYREAMTHEEAEAFVVAGKGTHFDPAVVDAFLKVSPKMRRLRPGA